MTAAIALAVVLAIVVAGASMAMESQRTTPRPERPQPARPTRPPRGAAPEAERPRRPSRGRDRGRAEPVVPDFPPPAATPPTPEPKGPELLRSGTSAPARVVSVVDERTLGPVTRSRLVLRIEPEGGSPTEVTVRHAFPTPESRAQIKVGASVPVRYDPADPHRVVIDLPRE